ncbi:MAG: DUF2461 domain-containing protein [Bacteroidota bacterium]
MNQRLASIWTFLEDLSANNSKEWMDEHRDRYYNAKANWLDQIQEILTTLSTHQPLYETLSPKDTITRINNNRVFHPDRPVYKGHFTFSPSSKSDQITSIFVAYGPEFTMIGGGLYRPDSSALSSIREAIDYDGEELRAIITDPTFVSLFGGLSDEEPKLKTSPKGYSKDHKHIDLLRYKSFTAQLKPSKEELIKGNLTTIVEDAYLKLQPLTQWLTKAISV